MSVAAYGVRLGGNYLIFFVMRMHHLRPPTAASVSFKVKFEESHRNPLIQLADMVAGAIARSYPNEARAANASWRNLLGNKIENVWDFR